MRMLARASRIVTGATKLVSIIALLTETRWETLSSRRKMHKLILFYKIKNNLSLSYLTSLVPNNVGDISWYNLMFNNRKLYMQIQSFTSVRSFHRYQRLECPS